MREGKPVLIAWSITEAKEELRKAIRDRRTAEQRAEEFASKLRSAAILLDYDENKFIDELKATEAQPHPG